MIIEREQKTCFSMEPVPQCENTEEVETTELQKVRFENDRILPGRLGGLA